MTQSSRCPFWTSTFLCGVILWIGAGCGSASKEERTAKQESGKAKKTVQRCTSATEDIPQYELELTLSRFEGYFVMKVNGFPVERLPGMSSMTEQEVTGQLNTALVGDENKAEVEVMPFLTRSGESLGTV